jgi:phosphatidyl-myo-inositol dimannoside synthase
MTAKSPTLLMLTSEFAPFKGGIATYTRELAQAAAAMGYAVTVVAPDYHADQSAVDAALPFRVFRFAGGPNTAKAIVMKTRWTARFARRNRFDIVHAVDWGFFIPVALSAFRRRSRCLLTFHGSEINTMARPSRRKILSAMRFWSGWATCVGNSRFTADYLRQCFPQVPADTVRAVPLAVRPTGNDTPFDRAAERKGLNLSDDDFAMVTLGRIVERKGHHVAVSAIRLLPEADRKKLVWIIIGPETDAEYAARIRADAATLDVRVRFTGGVPEEMLITLLRASDLFCLPAIWGRGGEFEGFGLVYLEAGLRGLPSIGTQLGGIPDAVIDGETGLLVSPDDAPALAAAITKLQNDTALRLRMAQNALTHAQAQTWDKVMRETYQ